MTFWLCVLWKFSALTFTRGLGCWGAYCSGGFLWWIIGLWFCPSPMAICEFVLLPIAEVGLLLISEPKVWLNFSCDRGWLKPSRVLACWFSYILFSSLMGDPASQEFLSTFLDFQTCTAGILGDSLLGAFSLAFSTLTVEGTDSLLTLPGR